MKYLSIALLSVLITVSVLTFFSFTNEKVVQTKIPIGTVIYSIMPPEYFESENPGWVLLKGQPIDRTSELFKMLELFPHLNNDGNEYNLNRLPNALGKFIRSSNFKDGSDTINRMIGSLQHSSTKLPNTPFNISGKAISDDLSKSGYKLRAYIESLSRTLNVTEMGDGPPNISETYAISKIATRHNSNIFALKNNIQKNGGTVTKYGDTEIISSHSHNLEINPVEGGDGETRPINITLYTYIKIN